MIAWIDANQGDIVRPEAPAPKRQSNVSPFLLSVATFTGLTSTLLIAFNISSARSRRRRFASTAPQPQELGGNIDEVPAVLDKKLNRSTKLVVIFTGTVSAIMAGSWLTSGKTYLDIGTSWLGLRTSQLAFGVGFFEGKIFYSSILTFALTFALGYYFLVEIQSQHPIKAIIVSGLVVLSAAYVFEYTYLFLNHQVLFKYLTQFHWWFNLLAGFVVGFGLGHMRIGRASVVLFSLFAIVMAVWYLGGYPQLAHKETPVLLFNNYIGYPATWAYPLNALAKFLSSMATVSLLLKAPSNFSKAAAKEETVHDNFIRADEIETRYQRTRTGDGCTKRNASNILRAPFRGVSRMRRNLFRIRTAFSGSFQDTSCSSCGRLLKLTDRYCDACGRPVHRQHGNSPKKP